MMNNDSRQGRIPGYLPALDGLRALSLILIFAYHTWQQSWIFLNLRLSENKYIFNLEPFQRYGYIAIDTFFVLSGFCLFYPIARSMFGESQFHGWKDFYIKRLRRIYPSYLLMLILLLIFPVLSWMTYGMSNPLEIAKHFFSHLFFVHNFSETTLGSMISTGWTMSIEVQFYVIFPLLCIPFKKKPVLTFVLMSAVSVALRLYFISCVDIDGSLGVPQAIPFGYLDVFGSGMLSAYFVVWARHTLKNVDRMKLLMTLLSIACMMAGLGYIYWLWGVHMPNGVSGGNVYFRYLYRGLFAAFMAGFLFTACFSYDIWQKKLWGNRFFVFLSGISYTVYLWHQNIYIFLKRVNFPYTPEQPPMNDRVAMDGRVFLCLTASTLIGVFVTKYIENPIVKYGYKGCALRIRNALRPRRRGGSL